MATTSHPPIPIAGRVRVAIVLTVLIGLAVVPEAPASPVASHAQIYACCTAPATKEEMFREAKASGANYIRVDFELHGIFNPGPFGIPLKNWSGADAVARLSRRYDLPVLAILLGSPEPSASCVQQGPDARRVCPPLDPTVWGAQAAEVARRYRDVISHFEVWNEPDGVWAFAGSPEEYAWILSSAYDQIHAVAPGARVVLGGTKFPTARGEQWLTRAFAVPGANAAQKFDIGSVHLRGRIAGMTAQLGRRREFLRGLGREVPVWVTEHGYSADPRWQRDPRHRGGPEAQAAYLAASIPSLAAAGAEQVFVTLRDGVGPEYEAEGIIAGHGRPGEAFSRRPAFNAVSRVAAD